ncbi:MAG: HK97 gp10 family phage protein [Clostridiales bacterium]|nr:HK97 gp10 family phage protein [Clostridiales bacterium]
MNMKMDITGLGQLTARLEKLQGGIPDRVVRACSDSANKMEGEAKSHAYDGIKQIDDTITDSIHALCENKGDSVEFGIFTDSEVAIYQEMGTGPRGEAAGYPGEPYLDAPIGYTVEGWDNKAHHPGPNKGVKPQAFMYNAVNRLKDAAGEEILDAVMEVLADD